ncbi:MAG: hypothetical protein HGA25_04920 [Clostridiales bacterium]|nr:hypothetical protein [Clostridiales bacterium]
MNKKSLISMLVSLCLVGVIGLGATFAYLSTTTGTLTNTFTVGKVNGTLLEKVDSGGTLITAVYGQTKGQAYNDLLPGQTIVKEPYITIDPESANAIAYIKVTGIDALLTLKDTAVPAHFAFGINNFLGAGWTKVAGTGTGYDAIYKYGTTLVAGTTSTTSNLFTGITFKSEVEGTTLGTFGEAVGNIKLTGCLVQADSIAAGDSTDTVAIAKLNP